MPDLGLSPNGIYELTLPDGYVYEEHDNGVSVYHETNGIGALTITVYTIPANYKFNLKAELLSFIESIDEHADPNVRTAPGGAQGSFISDDDFWKAWVVFRSPYGLFASYNCSLDDQRKELDRIDAIIGSIRFL